jgi:hypothetical protein
LSSILLWAILFGALLAIALLVKKRSDIAKVRRTHSVYPRRKDLVPDLPVPFGYKCAWYAARAEDPLGVASRLKLRQIKPSTWAEGVEDAYEASVFVTPPVRGWILAAGTGLFPSPPAFEATSARIAALSRIQGHAFLFATDRVTETHIWARATNGVLVRGYGYSGESGEVVWDFGPPTQEEADIDIESPDEQVVMEVARRWCVSPVDLPLPDSTVGLGVLGKP